METIRNKPCKKTLPGNKYSNKSLYSIDSLIQCLMIFFSYYTEKSKNIVCSLYHFNEEISRITVLCYIVAFYI